MSTRQGLDLTSVVADVDHLEKFDSRCLLTDWNLEERRGVVREGMERVGGAFVWREAIV